MRITAAHLSSAFCHVLALVTAVAVLSSPCSAEQPADATRPEIKSVKLQRTACYGTCPVYTVEISSDGMVKYVGNEHVAKLGNQSANVGRDEFEFLVAAIRRVKFLSLRDTYSGPKDGCEGISTDSPSIIISVQTNDTQKTVDYYGGCVGLELGILDRIYWLADTIDEVAGTIRWVEGAPIKRRYESLEPLQTEMFSLRYQKGEAMVALLSNKEHSILSERGSTVVDKRTNTLFVHDTPARIEETRKLIKQVDVPGDSLSPK